MYTSMGGSEDEENGLQKENISAMFAAFNQQMTRKKFQNVRYQSEVYTHFTPLETAVTSFSKGIFNIWVDNR